MERKIMNELKKWKIDAYKRPILLYGITGSGKTYTVLEFGKNEYKNTVYFDCDQNLELNYVVDKNNTLEKLIRGLSAISLETIFKEETLIIFDNVTTKVINAVKSIFVNKPEYHIIMITNDKKYIDEVKGEGIILKKQNLVTFEEYLKFVGKEQMIDFIEDSFKNNKPMPFHTIALELYNEYILTGGYPNAIIGYQQNQNYYLLSTIHNTNINLLKNKLLNLDNLIDITRGIDILNNIAFQLLKNNRKFQYGSIKAGARAKEYERVINYMEKDSIIIKSSRVSELTKPLSRIKEEENFRLYYNDTGILYKKMNTSVNRLMMNDKLLEILYENNVVSTLYQNGFNIYNYHSGGKAMIDIVIQTRKGLIVPIELIHNTENTKSKSLALSMSKYNLDFAIRMGTENFSQKKNVKYIPYYAAFCINDNL